MKNYDTYKELIYLMLDGEASEIERQTLFEALNESPELQSEFQNAIQINNAGASYSNTTEVPGNLTNSLFSKAGLTYAGLGGASNISAAGPSPAGKAVTGGSGKKLIEIALGKYGFGLLGLLLGGLLSLTFLGNWGTNTVTLSEESQINTVNAGDIPDASAYRPPEIKKVRGVDDNAIKRKTQKNRTYEKMTVDKGLRMSVVSPPTHYENNGPNSNGSTAKETKKIIVSTNNHLFTGSNLSNPMGRKISLSKVSEMNGQLNNVIEPLINNDKFGLEVNSSLFWNIPKETVAPDEIEKLHNMSAFLFYDIKKNISLGIGVRQETFYVKYNSTDELQRDYIYEQQPNLMNYELALRYRPVQFVNLIPFLQFNAGWGKYGYTGRVGAGTELKLYNNFALTFLMEYARLRFKHQSEWYDSQKIGFNYGIHYQF